MKFKIENIIFEQFPSLNIGIVLAKGINNTGKSPELLHMFKEQSNIIRAKYNLETLKNISDICSWREAYKSFGAKPKKYFCSVENLYRMIIKDIQLKHINMIVDIYNFISLKHIVPIGGDDIDKTDGDVILRFAKGHEPFIRLNSTEIDYPKKGEVVYADNKEILCRRWNWRECDKSKMTEATKNVILFVEGLPPKSKQDVQKIAVELGQLVEKFCGGKIETFILNSEVKEIKI